jgi:phosphopantothenoylcysteine decarboxylase/phosphopantothenate--cysteine ligase
MNQAMWGNEATQSNLQLLRGRGVSVFGPNTGVQACGDVGFGRMLEPSDLVDATAKLFTTGVLAGMNVVITAGPTREAIDPVRYISNYSSGKMGYALAQAAVEAGARTVLISGPTDLDVPEEVTRVSVITAEQMLAASLEQANECDIFIAAAAVADYRPRQVSAQKMKKTAADNLVIEFVKNPDIVASIAALPNKPFTVGFAAESENLIAYAQKKLQQKNLDMIIANNISEEGIGFNSDENAVMVIDHHAQQELSQRSKKQLARDLINCIASKLTDKK